MHSTIRFGDDRLRQGCPTFLVGGPSVQISNKSGARPDEIRDVEGVEGEGNGEGCPPPQPTRGCLGERRKLPHPGLGWSPGRKRVLA